MDNIEILNLKDAQHHLEEVSKWIWTEWGKDNGSKLEDIIYCSKHSINKNCIPQMYIAKLRNDVVGVVSLWTNDLVYRQDLTPWMATLYVKESYRNMGVGNKLQRKCLAEAKKLGYEYIYLTTKHDNYYEKSGWEFLEIAPLGNGRYEKIYKYNLKSDLKL